MLQYGLRVYHVRIVGDSYRGFADSKYNNPKSRRYLELLRDDGARNGLTISETNHIIESLTCI